MKTFPSVALISSIPFRRAGSLLVAILCLGMVATGQAQTPGTPDPTFTTSTGNVLQVGPQLGGPVVYNTSNDFLPQRVNADGTPDTAFTPAADTGVLLATQPDGKILTVRARNGMSYYEPTDELFRLNPDGSLDGGFKVYSPGYTLTKASVQPDGKIFVGSYVPFRGSLVPAYLTRINADGSADDSFRVGFMVSTIGSSHALTSITTQPDGKVLVSGSMLGDPISGDPFNRSKALILIRLNTDGSRDTTFTYGGDTDGDFVNAVALQPDGKILVGITTSTSDTSATNATGTQSVRRLNADGSLDSSFNTITTDLTGTVDIYSGTTLYGSKVNAVTLQPDGKIIIGGKFDQVDGVAAKNLARLNADGSLDTTFTGDDTVGVVASQALQFDGKLVVGGSTGLARLYAYTPVTTSAVTASGRVGEPFTYQITANNQPTSFAASSLPEGLSVDPATGLLKGTPTQTGTFYITLSTLGATGATTGTGPLTLTIAPAIPVVSGATTAAGMVGEPFTYTITASSSPVNYAANGLPGGLTLDAARGVISGTPTTAGMFTVHLSAINSGGTGMLTLTLTIGPMLPVATLVATVPAVTAGTDNIGEFILSLLPAPTGDDVLVNFKITGTAVDGTDYVFLKATKRFKKGVTSKPIKVAPLGQGVGTGIKRTVVLTLQPGTGYNVGTAGKVKVRIYGQ